MDDYDGFLVDCCDSGDERIAVVPGIEVVSVA